MNAAELIEYFDRLSEAPDAVARLRQFVLGLAVCGKLVPQIPSERISDNIPPTEPRAGRLFRIPSSWRWVVVGDVATCRLGKMLDKAKNRGTPRRYLRNVNVRWFDFDLSDVREMPFQDDELQEFSLRCGDVLVCEGGEPGRAAVWDEREATIYFQKAIHRVRLFPAVEPAFFVVVLRSAYQSGVLSTYFTGVGIKHFTGKGLATFAFPLPPVAEQKRILARIAALEAVCKSLESAQKQREQRRDRLVAASLHRLTQSADNVSTFQQNVAFHLQNLPRLTARPEHIQQLRQTILDLAVRGHLVSRTMESESTMLPTLASPQMSLGSNSAKEDWPAPIPRSWRWNLLGDLTDQITDGEHATPARITSPGIPLVTAKNVRNGFMDYTNTDWVSPETATKAWTRCRPMVGDILLVCVGATTGRLCVLREPHAMVLVRSVALIRPAPSISSEYLALVLRSPLCQQMIWKSVKITAQPCLYLNRIESLPIPLPPYDEQGRIVSKVEELLSLCEQISDRVSAAQEQCGRLLKSLVEPIVTTSDRN